RHGSARRHGHPRAVAVAAGAVGDDPLRGRAGPQPVPEGHRDRTARAGRVAAMRLRRERPSETPYAAATPAAPVERPLDLTVEPDGRRLGERLLAGRLVQREQLVAALTEAHTTPGTRLGRVLVAAGAIDEPTLARAVADQHGLDVVDLRDTAPEAA